MTYKPTRDTPILPNGTNIHQLKKQHVNQLHLIDKLPADHPIRSLVFQTQLNKSVLLPEQPTNQFGVPIAVARID